MRVLIHFTPKGETKTLYADMTEAEYDAFQRILADPSQGDQTLYIRSRVERDGPTKEWMFRARLTRLEVER